MSTIPENFVVSPIDDGRMWTFALHTAEGELIAVSARTYHRPEECVAAIIEVLNRYEFDLTVRQRNDGRWRWEMSKSGRPLLTSARTHSLPTFCGSAMRRVKRLVEDLARAMGPAR